MKKYLSLFWTMFKIGLFTFGGGYAMISLLENEFVQKQKLMEKYEFVNMLAIAESSPGPVAINNATYIGYKVGKIWGSIISTVAVCLPSIIIIYLISLFFDAFLSLEFVNYAFKWIQACVSFLILNAGFSLFKTIEKNVYNYVLLSIITCLIIVFALFSIKFSVIYYLLIGGTLGLVVHFVNVFRSKKSKVLLEEKHSDKEEK